MRPMYSRMLDNGNQMTKTGFHDLHVFWCTEDYDEDHIEVLIKREMHRMDFHFQSPQISERKKLVDLMRAIAAKKGLDNFTIHLAVYLLDVFMDNYNIVNEKLQLIVLVCLLVATKFEERDCNVLKANELNKIVHNKYSLSDYYGLEILILKHLSWNLLLPSAVHFVHVYVEFLFTDDDFQEIEFKTKGEIWSETRLIIKNYLDYVMEDVHLMHEKPSRVGAAIMAITRKNLGLIKIWPQKLSSLTGYKLFELKPIILKFKHIANNNSQ